NDTFKRALDKKVKMIFGTDGGAGAHGRNFEELVYRVRDGGQPPMEAIISATSLSAESLRMQDRIGSIAQGMEADIIATDGNPLDLRELVGRRLDQRQLTLFRQHQQQILIAQQHELTVAVASALPFARAVLEIDAREDAAVEAEGEAFVHDEVVEVRLQPARRP